MPRAPAKSTTKEEPAPICVRVPLKKRAAWEAALEPGETLSSLIRAAVDRELARRREARELEERRQLAGPAGVVDLLDGILEQARAAPVLSPRTRQ